MIIKENTVSRKGREKQNRLKQGAVIKVLDDGIGLSRGYYTVLAISADLISLQAGEMTCGTSSEFLPRYRVVSKSEEKSIDWKAQEERATQFYEERFGDGSLWEEIELPELDEDENLFFTTTIRQLRMH